MWFAPSQMSLSTHHCQRENIILLHKSGWLVPILLMHTTAVEFSSKRWTYFPAILCSKHLSAKKVAFSSNFHIIHMKLCFSGKPQPSWTLAFTCAPPTWKAGVVSCSDVGSLATMSFYAELTFSNHHCFSSLAQRQTDWAIMSPFSMQQCSFLIILKVPIMQWPPFRCWETCSCFPDGFS